MNDDPKDIISAENPYFDRAERSLNAAVELSETSLGRETLYYLKRAQVFATLAEAWEARQARIYRDTTDYITREQNRRAIEYEANLNPKEWLLGRGTKTNPVTGLPFEDDRG